ncbi:Swt1 family HEPN domain-containing protein [Arthrobacter sp. NicSoilB8]|uniref:Swt1 family HEPN domain-containing protein n=1 Tax=Arthrobacter sp. NicSoilB8 TaxID=2830998 RepID=UPI001CC61827|nr:Swt1 family HEPN domain-containing protein [Arthrobacter sp. NicSoilB8]BCW69970.1 hypothetical protein NicSoilB8_10140 [Arthrobacter sp. NicSoilB8]
MALTNNEKVGRGFALLADGLRGWVDERMQKSMPSTHKAWVDVIAARDAQKYGKIPTHSLDDPRFLLRVITEDWRVFANDLNRVESAFATELRKAGNDWAHGEKFDSDDTGRTLDTIERLLEAVGAAEQAKKAGELHYEHQRDVFEKQTRNRVLRATNTVNVPGAVAGTAIKPWREVITPHPDVMKGQFSAAEFAADLYAVANDLSTSPEYTNPCEFFARTYLTSGLEDLLERALRRLSGDASASPVVNLQTQFGGGKTHSMLALYHLFSGVETTSLPQGVQDLVYSTLGSNGGDPLASLDVKRITLVGTRFSPGQPSVKDDGTQVRTLWGELAWQLGGRSAFERVANADANAADPGEALDSIIRDAVTSGTKVLILIDEWVAYARQLVGRDDLPGGSFSVQHTFAQHLTEMAKTTPGVMLVVSVPASDSLDDGGGGSALEVGGPNGHVALETLQQVIGRNGDDWRPANNIESFEIVRRRLFQEPDAAALADIAAVAKQYVKYYQENTGFFPRETTSGEYEARFRAAYPIHPELFDRLYEDWSALPKFQRTRGVLRLMSVVINALWNVGDTAPLIAPGSVPVNDTQVFSEITKYLDDNWKPIVDKDVDGEGSTPVFIDKERPSFGARALTRRIARTVFIATVPTLRAAHRGVDAQHLRLGAAVPGDVMSHMGDARELLGQRATYFYEDGDRYWYDVAASVSRVATDRSQGYREADVHAEIADRLVAESRKNKGAFAGIHAAPTDTGDVPDSDALRLVLLHPRFQWTKEASAAGQFAEQLLTQVGSSQRQRRNMIILVAPDRGRYPELEGVVREYKAWKSIASEADQLELSPQQRNQAVTRANQLNDAVDVRLRATYTAALVPNAVPGEAPRIDFVRIGDMGGTLAERVTSTLKTGGKVTEILGTQLVRMALDGPLSSAWASGHVRFGDLWNWFAQHPYLKRLKDRSVLEKAVLGAADVLLWQNDAFALADAFDDATERYIALWLPQEKPEKVYLTDDTLLVKPEHAAQQRAKESQSAGECIDGTADGIGKSQTPVPNQTNGGSTTAPPGTGGATMTPPPTKPTQRRFFGVKTLNSEKYAADFSKVQQEVLAHLDAVEGVQLEVRIEITAMAPAGFSEQQVRTVRENATQLRFDQQGFEEA